MNLTVRAEELGDDLRRLREQTGLSLERAGELIDASATKMSRIENGLREGSPEDVAALLAIYRCVGPRRAELLALAHEFERRGWWQRNKPDFAERVRTLINLENKADLIVNFEGMNIPGLLQTGEYTRALLRESGLVPDSEVEHRMVIRMQRHALLLKPKPPKLLAIIDELALHRMVGGDDVMRRQLDYLDDAAKQSNIDLRIVPNSGGHAGANGAFALFRRANGHKAVYLENLTSVLILEEDHEITRYEQAIRLLVRRALPAQESILLINKLARRLDPEATQGELAEEQLQRHGGELR
ncbi:helix-turn-helix domain-containing protein [Lentzea tibetensis]|uniref:Helix-turn-helix domain-containing protein n=1 Tax=Lentzea tibetensis TaxID=2591470 RepID=A0A563F0D1_9PSEU|nr:helix-turn-helix transcriptional regulator [Lentzea tibetensis]TWP53436.1 helix-turn-helix domain-containing protein [Lentzea tibetensis]